MKMIRRVAKVNTTNKMTIAFDVSKDKLNYYSEVEGKIVGNNFSDQFAIEDEIKNTPLGIMSCLDELREFAESHGFDGIHIICEPTGSYSNLLLNTAHRKGHTTAYVNGESVYKAKVIENNDNSKDDIKDPRVIFMLSKMGKEQTYRILPPEYKALRDLNRLYDVANKYRIEMKTRVHHLLVRLFSEFPMGNDFIYHHSGHMLFEEYGFSPWKIVEDSFDVFSSKMRKRCKGIFRSSLTKLYAAAQYSVLHVVSELELGILEQHFRYLYEDYFRAEKRRNSIRKQIEDIYYDLAQKETKIPIADEKVMQPFYLGRILGETGPLSDFSSINELQKYSGLNLRKRESGYYKGKLKMSKKGRAPLRGILGGMAFKLVKKCEIYGEYYHRRKNEEGLSGTKLLAIVERKLLKMIFGMAKNNESYNQGKFMKCESQYKLVA